MNTSNEQKAAFKKNQRLLFFVFQFCVCVCERERTFRMIMNANNIVIPVETQVNLP